MELWASIRQDDVRAFNLLFDKYWRRLYQTAYSLTRDQEASKEITHDVFLNIWKRRGELHIDSFPHFLLTAIRYQYYNRMRAAKSPIVLVPDYQKLDGTIHRDEYEGRQTEADLTAVIKEYLTQLPNRCREIFLMSRRDHLSNEEIANHLNISKRTVENQITYALKHLRQTIRSRV